MLKKISIIVLCFALAVFGVCLPTYAASNLILSSPFVSLIDGKTHSALYSTSKHSRRAPASTTKLLTAMVVLDNLPLGKVVKIPAGMQNVQRFKLEFQRGERFYVRDLLRAALICSANDAAESLAIIVAGSRKNFSRLLNKKLYAIGGKESNFIYASGLPAEGQYSTASDLAKIIEAATKYSFIVETLKIDAMKIRSLDGRVFGLRNSNKMLLSTKSIIGKTGYTKRAGHCFAGRIVVGNRVLYVGILGSANRKLLWTDLRKIQSFYGSGGVSVSSARSLTIPSKQKTVQIQNALRKAGFFTGKATGFYGNRTRLGVRNFQKSKGLVADGIVGAKTWKILKGYL